MTFKEYIPKAMRTMVDIHGASFGPNGHPASLWTPADMRMIHSAIGISTEVSELSEKIDQVNHVEELGDVTWYCAAGMSVMPTDAIDEMNRLIHDLRPGVADQLSLVGLSGGILDQVKRFVFYRKQIDIALFRQNILEIMLCVRRDAFQIIRGDYNETLSVVFDANIAKLTRRYPEKFTEDLALHRDLAAEHQVLESHIAP